MPASSTPVPDRASINRLLRWCLIVFVAAAAVLGGLFLYAWWQGNLMAYFTAAGVLYLACSVFFLTVVMIAFIGGHLGSSDEIEAPKLELFEMEERE